MGSITANPRLKVVVVRKANNQIVFEKSFSTFPIIFGRGEQCHIPLVKFQSLSRTHGSITMEGNYINVYDLNSTNGIFVNQDRMTAFAMENEGKFVTGELVFFVRIEKPAVLAVVPRAPGKSNGIPGRVNVPTPPTGGGGAAAQQIQEEELGDLSHLTKSSVRLVHTAKSLKLEKPVDLSAHRPEDIALQGIVTWGDDIFDVRQFVNGDKLIVGSEVTEPIYVPSLKQRALFGKFSDGAGYFAFPPTVKWRLQHKGYDFTPEEATAKNLAKKSPQGAYAFRLGLADLCTIDLGDQISLHLRYVEIPRPLITRTWIENREEFKKASRLSLMLHLIVCIIALLSTPKTNAPKVENVPARFAKLLVEPPPQILAAQPPPPPPEEKPPEPPVPPPEPPKVEKKPDPPKPKKIVKQDPPKPKPVPPKPAPPKPVAKQPPAPPPPKAQPPAPPAAVAQRSPNPTPNTQTAPKQAANPPSQSNVPPPAQQPPKPTAPTAEQMANSFANAFSSAPAAKPGVKTDIKIGNQAGPPAGNPKISNLVSDLKNASGQNSGSGTFDAGPSLGKKVGNQGYAGTEGGVAGKRAVGGVVLGTPKFEAPSSPQGLSNDEVMKVVNKHLGEVHRCYERALFQDSNLVGRVEYEWNINPAGSVTSVSVKRADMNGADFLNNCVMGVFKKMKFPASTNKQPTVANIGFPFGKQ